MHPGVCLLCVGAAGGNGAIPVGCSLTKSCYVTAGKVVGTEDAEDRALHPSVALTACQYGGSRPHSAHGEGLGVVASLTAEFGSGSFLRLFGAFPSGPRHAEGSLGSQRWGTRCTVASTAASLVLLLVFTNCLILPPPRKLLCLWGAPSSPPPKLPLTPASLAPPPTVTLLPQDSLMLLTQS